MARRPQQLPDLATYAGIVEATKQAHARRLAELKSAERLIRAVEPDLAALRAQKVPYGIDNYSMCLRDVGDLFGRRQFALRILGGIFSESRDRLAQALLDRGYVVQKVTVNTSSSTLVLRREKTQVRVVVDATAAFGNSLKSGAA